MIFDPDRWFPGLTNQKILVTGASGFIGGHLIRMMQSMNLEILGIDKRPQNRECRSPFRLIDCRDLTALKQVFAEFQPEVVIHLAARTDLRGRSLDDYSDNILGSKNVINLSVGSKLIAASTRLVFNPHVIEPSDPFSYSPKSWYGESKVMMEKFMTGHSNATIVRPTSIWGPNCGEPFNGLIRNIRRGTYIQSQSREIIKTLGYVKNTAYQIICLAVRDNLPNSPINLGDGNIDMNVFCNSLARELHVRQPLNVNFTALEIASRVGSFLSRVGLDLPLTHERFMNIYNSQTYSLELIQDLVPKLPFTQSEALAEFALWGKRI